MKKHWKKIAIVGGIVLFVLILVLVNMRKRAGGTPEVRVESVARGSVERIARAEGTIEALNQVNIGSDIMGRIVEIRVRQGDRVKKGDTLCVVDPRVYREQVSAAQASLAAQEANLAKLREDYARTKALYERGLISKSQFEQAESAFRAAEAQINAAKAQLGQVRVTYSKAFITSPVDGEVVAVNMEVGEQVIAGTVNISGSVIMVVADMSRAIVKADVSETEVVDVAPGQDVRVKIDAFPGRVFRGVVGTRSGVPTTSSSLSSVQQAVSYPVEVFLDEVPKGLLPGMSASCEIITERVDSVIVVPLTAVGSYENQDVVYVFKNGKAVRTPVKLGVVGEGVAEVKEGLSEGDQVITGPASVLVKIKDGTRVKVKKEPGKPGEEKKRGRPPVSSRGVRL
ncbi:MAG: efflux RND transporter periplasmic adaptor subunit [candidate division WOR-3 bacterium]